MMPATEVPCWELLDDLLQAESVTRVTDTRGDNFVAWFPKRLKGYLAGTIQGRDEPVRDGARSIWYNVSKYGSRRAEQLAKRHLKRHETRRAMWTRLTRDDGNETEVAEVKRKYTGKQPPRKAEGREVAYRPEVEGDPLATHSVALIDLFGGVSSVRVAAISAGYQISSHGYVEVHGNAVKVVKAWFPDLSLIHI